MQLVVCISSQLMTLSTLLSNFADVNVAYAVFKKIHTMCIIQTGLQFKPSTYRYLSVHQQDLFWQNFAFLVTNYGYMNFFKHEFL